MDAQQGAKLEKQEPTSNGNPFSPFISLVKISRSLLFPPQNNIQVSVIFQLQICLPLIWTILLHGFRESHLFDQALPRDLQECLLEPSMICLRGIQLASTGRISPSLDPKIFFPS